MAIIKPWNLPIDIKEMKYAIKGNMILSQIVMSEYELMHIVPDDFSLEIKRQLIANLMDKIMETRSVEFTKMENHIEGKHYFRARLFAVPDDQVRILRLSQLNNSVA
jgi:hypothetical protein